MDTQHIRKMFSRYHNIPTLTLIFWMLPPAGPCQECSKWPTARVWLRLKISVPDTTERRVLPQHSQSLPDLFIFHGACMMNFSGCSALLFTISIESAPYPPGALSDRGGRIAWSCGCRRGPRCAERLPRCRHFSEIRYTCRPERVGRMVLRATPLV